MGESTDSWAREGKWKFFGGSAHCIERCFRSLGSLLLRLDEGHLTNASWAHLTVESYGRIVKDSSCVHWKSEEHNSDRWLAFQNRKRDDISNEKHTHRSRFSPAMPRTSFPDNLWKSPLFWFKTRLQFYPCAPRGIMIMRVSKLLYWQWKGLRQKVLANFCVLKVWQKKKKKEFSSTKVYEHPNSSIF